MSPYRMPVLLRRSLAAVLAALLEMGPLLPAYAGPTAPTPLGDAPLNTQNSAKPNVVLTVDDSTSMLDDFLPDYVAGTFCRGGLGGMNATCGRDTVAKDFTVAGGGKYFTPGYVFEQYGYPYPAYAGGYDASGPGAGCYAGGTPTCSGGVNPGPLPGASQYPAGPQPSWPNSLQPYEYWLLWPAPAHSTSLNPLYYDPTLTYDPPVDSTGTPYDTMDDAHTGTWTKVPADPWASPVAYVDLVNGKGSTPVYDGLWCDSDWNLNSGNAASPDNSADPMRCRYNGQGGAAFGSVSLADGQDYTYPWAPPNFGLSASPGATVANTYAAQKVKLTSASNPTDPNYIKYGALFGEQVNDGTNGTPNVWNATSQNQKFFYENENILWCDPTSPSWPQTGPVQTQTCGNYVSQLCSAFAGQCQNPVNGSCKNAPSCSGSTVGTCSGYLPPLCQGSAGVCNGFVAASCTGAKCLGSSAQTCNGTSQTCPTNAQTCSGPFNQTCNLPGTQTCQPPVCTITYVPAGCNTDPNWPPEESCVAQSTCAPPVCTPNPGTCSIQTTKSCTQNSDCTPQPGACSISGAACMSQTDCPNIGTCSILGNLCTSVSDCAIVGGSCSKTGQACTKSSDCPASGNCSIGGAVCLVDSNCPGTCGKPVGQVCMSAATCNATNGLCSDGVTVCQSAAQCPLTGGLCQTLTCQDGATVCTKKSDCNSVPGTANCTAKACTLSGQCPQTFGKCTAAGGKNGNNCTVAADCLTKGTCSNSASACAVNTDCGYGVCNDNVTKCSVNTDCPKVGTCNTNGLSCVNNNQCPAKSGFCTLQTTVACNVPGVDLAECPNVGKCSITGSTCTSNNDCSQLPGPLPPSAAACNTGGVGGVNTATLRADAENNGVVCRRNNKASGAYTSGAFDYPSGKFLTPITGTDTSATAGPTTDACPATNHYVQTPRHYWKSEVQWCDTAIATAGDKWFGFGTANGGTCLPRPDSPSCTSGASCGKDSTHVYPRFFQFGAANYVDNYANAAFQRVDLDISKRATATYTHTWVDVTGQTQTITRSFDQEMTNYANWFAYYRTRIQAVKTVTSLTFTALDDQYRVGFHTLSNQKTAQQLQPTIALPAQCASLNDPAKFVNVDDFTPGQKSTWFGELFDVSIPLCIETPTLNAMERIGEYFLNGSSPELSGSSDPITISCQRNWHMLFTDGFTNQAKPANLVGDQDDKIPASYPVLLSSKACVIGTEPACVLGLTPGQQWPPPYRENSAQLLGNAASDYAMNYWVTDLRTSGPNATTDPAATNNVPVSGKDPAWWQHLNFAALSLGTQGKLPTANQTLTEDELAKGLAAGGLDWPQITPGCKTCTVANQPDNSGVDDLWHAAINGRGRFVNAQTAAELKLGMGQILQDIANQAGSRAGAGLASSSISLSNHAVYVVTFQPGWAGTLAKINVDPKTGAETAPIWQAATQLNQQLAITVSDPTPWFTKRTIFTVNGDTGQGVPFVWGNLSAAQQDALSPQQPPPSPNLVGQAVLEYLRGNPANEGTGIGQFRVRSLCVVGAITPSAPTGISCSPPPLAGGFEDFLGDIVDSQAVYVGPPNFPYLDGNDPGYSSFVAANSGRPARVYVGGNDGMLHAFDDATGNEAFAFIPLDVYRPDDTGLAALSYQDGALPAFHHHYYVDSTPRIYDAFIKGDWRTLLVGGLGKGGKSYYAIDVTNPADFTDEATASTRYLWSFTDSDMGYTYGQPIITKTHASDGPAAWPTWTVVMPSGYNNSSGDGKIFFVDASNGSLLKMMDTGVSACKDGEPSGLAHIAGYTKDFHNQLTEQIYGGDLCGNLWRFDISDTDPSNWTVQRLAQLTDSGGNPQPVTTPPEIEVDVINGVDRWVFIGTGRLLAAEDLTTTSIADQQQTFYAIRDGTITTPNPIDDLNPITRADLVPLADRVNGLSTKPPKGWYDDLPTSPSTQRIVTPVKAALSLVAYAGTSAQDNPCLTGEPATLYVRTFSEGESLLADAGGVRVSGIDETQGAVGLDVTIFTDSGGTTAGGIDIRIAVTGANSTFMFQTTIPQPELGAHRMSWRLLGQ